MAKNSNSQAKVKEMLKQLEDGVKDLFTSDKFKEYLQTMSKFYSYSTRNTILIHMQNPDATNVAGYKTWTNKFNRQVKRGEKGIRILAPTPFTVMREQQKLDPETNMPVIGNDGLPETEEIEVKIPRFKPAYVYDVSQTEGEPLRNLVENIAGDVEHYDLLMEALQAISPLPIKVVELDPDEFGDGACRYGHDILLRAGMSEVQTIAAAVHEITHAKLHTIKINEDIGKEIIAKDENTKEIEAEAVSYVVCQNYGIETAPNSFGYIADWSKTRELKELNSSLETIRMTAAELIDSINSKFRELAVERGIDLTAKYEEADEVIIESDENDEKTSVSMFAEKNNDYVTFSGTLPDPEISIHDMNEYGYTYNQMLPLGLNTALKLFDQDIPVYLLYEDDTEGMALEREDISQDKVGIYGVEIDDWLAYCDLQMLKAQQNEAEKEAMLIYGNKDMYGIYQIENTHEVEYAFSSMPYADDKISRSDYKLVYTDGLEPGMDLDSLFALHNADDRPAAQEMRSMSVSDIVVLKKGGEINSFYVDRHNFVKLPSFLGAEKQEEEQTAETYSQVGNTHANIGPTVAELEADVKAGKQISLLELAKASRRENGRSNDKKKPSILAQLRDGKNRTSGGAISDKSAPNKKNEPEI